VPRIRAGSIDSDSTTSTLSTESWSAMDQEGIIGSTEDRLGENDGPSFEERHSLTTVLKHGFETEDDPHGANELLELMASLKAAKKVSQVMQS
jgi:hypothetical protein